MPPSPFLQSLCEHMLTRRYGKRTIDSYLYNKYLGVPLGSLGEFNKARQPRKLPVVLTPEEVRRLLGSLCGGPALLASLLYGSGLRRIEAIRLRVKDVDFDNKWGQSKNTVVTG